MRKGDKSMNTMRIEYEKNKKHIEELRERLHQLIAEKGVSSKEVIKVSTDLDKLIVKHYPQRFSRIPNQSRMLFRTAKLT